MQWYLVTAVVLAVTILPYFLGIYLARALRVPDFGQKLGVIFCAVAISTAIILGGELKSGIDLKGGVILVYDVDEAQTQSVQSAERSASNGDDDLSSSRDNNGVDMNALVSALIQRINRGGVKDIVIRPYGNRQVEIIVPEVNEGEIRRLKERIVKAGFLEFRILASPTDHADLIRLADQPSQAGRPQVTEGNKVVGEWVGVDLDALSDNVDDLKARHKVRTTDDGRLEVLVDIDAYNVQGSHLDYVRVGMDSKGGHSVDFWMKPRGARRFGELTGENAPDPQTGRTSDLGIIMDGELLSYASIQSRITDQGQITGRFTLDKVEFLTDILNAGRLPAVLNENPSEHHISPLLGADTIEKGKVAVVISTIAVYLFMILYYRLAGVVACIALTLNLLIVIALMIAMKASMTMSGLAGIALTAGMAVDANVLIFERIREELQRGTALRMALRNGFQRAITTIIDSNVTTLISSVVLYAVGTDQIRGFAATLTLGILASMFTAVFCTRVMLELGERKRWYRTLNMMHLFSSPNYDIIGKRKLAFAASAILIVIGLAAVAMRTGRAGIPHILDTDFTGGTSVSIMLTEGMNIEDVRARVKPMADDTVVKQLRNPKRGSEVQAENTTFQIDTSLESVEELQTKIEQAFRDGQGKSLLVSHSMTFDTPKPASASSAVPDIKAPGSEGSADEPQGTSEYRPAERGSGWPTPIVPMLLAQATAETESTETAPTEPPSTAPPATDGGNPPASDDSTTAAPAGEPLSMESTMPSSPAVTSAVYLTETVIRFDEAYSRDALRDQLVETGKRLGLPEPNISLTTDLEVPAGSTEWKLKVSWNAEQTRQVLESMQNDLQHAPVWLSSTTIGSRVAGDMQQKAIAALLVSLVGILAYIWIRFQHLVFGVAAIVALVHDVVITLGFVAISFWLSRAFGFLLIEDFKVSMSMLAAFLTIIGYSLNDTIVVFDRIREVRGKSPEISEKMINDSINMTLSRTMLTSTATLLVVLILYAMGGQGVHGFAFAMFIGIVVGTYSSIYVASPLILWWSRAKPQSV